MMILFCHTYRYVNKHLLKPKYTVIVGREQSTHHQVLPPRDSTIIKTTVRRVSRTEKK